MLEENGHWACSLRALAGRRSHGGPGRPSRTLSALPTCRAVLLLQIPEADFVRALRAAVEAAQQLVEPQRQLAAQTG